MDGLSRAIELLGSQAALARAIGVVPMAISNWKTRGVPVQKCGEIEKATAGAVRKHDLRPDIFDAPAAPALALEQASAR